MEWIHLASVNMVGASKRHMPDDWTLLERLLRQISYTFAHNVGVGEIRNRAAVWVSYRCMNTCLRHLNLVTVITCKNRRHETCRLFVALSSKRNELHAHSGRRRSV